MVPADTVYPLALGAVNVAAGWLLYALLELRLGAPVGVLGGLVLVAVLSQTGNRVRPAPAVES
ncbi:hypothetical protein [Halolamina salifodinae]|uniref:Uncharacterized protein n=1 Tax=Halolamina salifodinae TaxID=1202767 RepID=A0A8T4H3A4_9EURY|nr:hypothetical protein [Halolamina salifodinae]MBP1987688.1 hypothetical protein [Halolamina salifodinae]